MQISLKGCFSNPLLGVMNFLSEVTHDFPDAISFATGSPMESFFDVNSTLQAIDYFVESQGRFGNKPHKDLLNDLGQYNRTNGIINGILAQHLSVDEGIQVCPEAIVVTSGSQEAMAVLMMGLFDAAMDVLLVSDPTYIGITGLASILGIQVIPIPIGDHGLHMDAVVDAINDARKSGKRARALYEIPDFNNPLGTSMPLSKRRELLQVAFQNEMFIIEDNPYGMFVYEGEHLPTLKSLDKNKVVLYIGTFSKTLFPGLRMGFLVADQQLSGGETMLAQELSKVKSFTTVNTSPILQGIVGGVLLKSSFSLSSIIEDKRSFYRANRDRMLIRLEEAFHGNDLRDLVHWNKPAGGFFLTVTLPFPFDEECFRTCASQYGILCCPISFFTLSQKPSNQIRLSFCYLTPEKIDEGIRRFAHFVRDRISTM